MKNNLHEEIKGPALAVDTIVFSIKEDKLVVLLIKIGSGPYKNKWALPGGLVQINETLDSAAIRVLKNKTNIKKGHLEQLYTFGDLDRDIRGQIVSTAYLLLVENIEKFDVRKTELYTDISWSPVGKLPPMAFDHGKMIKLAQSRLRSKMLYSNIVYSLLPSAFTLSDLQKIYEIILGRKEDKRNFRKKMLDTNILIVFSGFKKGAFRPAQMYKFKCKEISYF